jgi:hypothetical protein
MADTLGLRQPGVSRRLASLCSSRYRSDMSPNIPDVVMRFWYVPPLIGGVNQRANPRSRNRVCVRTPARAVHVDAHARPLPKIRRRMSILR